MAAGKFLTSVELSEFNTFPRQMYTIAASMQVKHLARTVYRFNAEMQLAKLYCVMSSVKL